MKILFVTEGDYGAVFSLLESWGVTDDICIYIDSRDCLPLNLLRASFGNRIINMDVGKIKTFLEKGSED